MDLLPGIERGFHADLILQILIGFERDGARHLFAEVALDLEMLVLLDLFVAILLDDVVRILADELETVFLHAQVELLLAMNEDLLGSLLVLETDLVESAAALR